MTAVEPTVTLQPDPDDADTQFAVGGDLLHVELRYGTRLDELAARLRLDTARGSLLIDPSSGRWDPTKSGSPIAAVADHGRPVPCTVTAGTWSWAGNARITGARLIDPAAPIRISLEAASADRLAAVRGWRQPLADERDDLAAAAAAARAVAAVAGVSMDTRTSPQQLWLRHIAATGLGANVVDDIALAAAAAPAELGDGTIALTQPSRADTAALRVQAAGGSYAGSSIIRQTRVPRPLRITARGMSVADDTELAVVRIPVDPGGPQLVRHLITGGWGGTVGVDWGSVRRETADITIHAQRIEPSDRPDQGDVVTIIATNTASAARHVQLTGRRVLLDPAAPWVELQATQQTADTPPRQLPAGLDDYTVQTPPWIDWTVQPGHRDESSIAPHVQLAVQLGAAWHAALDIDLISASSPAAEVWRPGAVVDHSLPTSAGGPMRVFNLWTALNWIPGTTTRVTVGALSRPR